jgi:hypothetical protein
MLDYLQMKFRVCFSWQECLEEPHELYFDFLAGVPQVYKALWVHTDYRRNSSRISEVRLLMRYWCTVALSVVLCLGRALHTMNCHSSFSKCTTAGHIIPSGRIQFCDMLEMPGPSGEYKVPPPPKLSTMCSTSARRIGIHHCLSPSLPLRAYHSLIISHPAMLAPCSLLLFLWLPLPPLVASLFLSHLCLVSPIFNCSN